MKIATLKRLFLLLIVNFLMTTVVLSATFTVTNNAASGAGSFAQAVIDANSLAGTDNIVFNIPGGGAQVITPTAGIIVTSSMVIDGTTQPGYTFGSAMVKIAGVNKITVQNTTAVTIKGLDLSGNSTGLRMTNVQSSTISNNIMTGNTYGMLIDGNMNSNVFDGNNLDANQIGFYQSGGSITNSTITNNTLRHTKSGNYTMYLGGSGTPAAISGNDFTGSFSGIYLFNSTSAFTFSGYGSGGPNQNIFARMKVSIFQFNNCSNLTVNDISFPGLFADTIGYLRKNQNPLSLVNCNTGTVVNNNDLSGFYNGINAAGNQNCVISNNNFSGSTYAGYYSNSGAHNNCSFINNNFKNIKSNQAALCLAGSGTPTSISGNDFTGCQNVITLYSSTSTFAFSPLGSAGPNQNIFANIRSNIFNLNNCYNLNLSNFNFPGFFADTIGFLRKNQNPLIMTNCNTGTVINNNDLSGFYTGIQAQGNQNCMISNNNFSGNQYSGYYSYQGAHNNCSFINNNFKNIKSNQAALCLAGSGTPTAISGNDFTGCQNVILLYSSTSTFAFSPLGSAGPNQNIFANIRSNVFNFNNCYNLNLSNFNFPGFFADTIGFLRKNQNPLTMTNCNSGTVINNNDLSGFYNGINANGNQNCVFSNNNFSGNTYSGYYSNTGAHNNCSFINNNFKNIKSNQAALCLAGSGTPTAISGNDFTGCQNVITLYSSTSTFAFSPLGSAGPNQNTFANIRSNVFNFNNCYNLNVSNFNFPGLFADTIGFLRKNQNPLIMTNCNTGTVINNNDLSGFYNGIQAQGNQNCMISNNNFSGNQYSGYYSYQGAHNNCSFINNNFKNIKSNQAALCLAGSGTPTAISGNDFTGCQNVILLYSSTSTFAFSPLGSAGPNQNTFANIRSNVFNFYNCYNLNVSNFNFPGFFADTIGFLRKDQQPFTMGNCNTGTIINNNDLSGFYVGINAQGNQNCVFSNNNFSGNQYSGYNSYQGAHNNCSFVNNNFKNIKSNQAALLLNGSGTPTSISGNDFTGCQNAVTMNGSGAFTFSPSGSAGPNQNTFAKIRSSIFKFTACHYLNISNWNFPGIFADTIGFLRKDQQPIHLSDCNYGTINNNDLSGFYTGIHAYNNQQYMFSNNNFSGCTYSGYNGYAGSHNGNSYINNNFKNIKSNQAALLLNGNGTPTAISGNNFTGCQNVITLATSGSFTFSPAGSGGPNENIIANIRSSIFNFQNCLNLNISNWDFPSLYADTIGFLRKDQTPITFNNGGTGIVFNNNNFSGFSRGINANNAQNYFVTNNNFSGCYNGGFYSALSHQGSTFINNNFSNCLGSQYALFLGGYHQPAAISGNNFTGCLNNIYLSQANTFVFGANTFSSLNGRALQLYYCTGITFSNNVAGGGIYMQNTSNSTFLNNDICHSGPGNIGFDVLQSSNTNTFRNNRIAKSALGFRIQTSNNNIIDNNTFSQVTTAISNSGTGNTITNSQTIPLPTWCPNTPPVAICRNITVSTDSACFARVSAAQINNGSSDVDAEVLTFALFPAGPYAAGVNNVVLTATDPRGASSSCNAVITVTPTNNLSLASAPSSVCAGTSVTLTGSGASTYVWDNAVQNGVAFVPTVTRTYTLTGTDALGCVKTLSQTIVVNPSPMVSVSSTSPTLCAAGSSTLSTATTGLVGYYKFDEGAGNTASDISGNNLNGTFVNSTSWASSSAFAGANNTAAFYGGYINVADNAVINSMQSKMTIEAWVFQTDGSNNTIVDRANYNFLFEINPNGAPGLGLYNPNIGWRYSSTNIPVNQWVHVAMTWDDASKTLKFYKNGVLTDTFILPTSLYFNAGPINIGRQEPNGCQCNTMNGNIDELRLWNTTRTQAEIQSNMNSGLGLSSAGSTFAWSPSTGLNTTTGATVVATPAATTTYTVTATSANGCTSTASTTVTVNQLPTLTVPANMILNTSAGQCNAALNYAVTVSGIPAPTISYSIPSGSLLNLGLTTVTVTATNTCGTVSQSFTVSVIDNVAPTVLTQGVSISLNSNGQASINTAQINNGSTDACGIASMTLSKTKFTCADVGSNTVTLTVTDVNGNTSSATAVVLVDGSSLPVLTVASNGPVCNSSALNLTANSIDIGGLLIEDKFNISTINEDFNQISGSGNYNLAVAGSGGLTGELVAKRTGASSSNDRRYIRSNASNFKTQDFTFDVRYEQVTGNNTGDLIFIGLGDGEAGAYGPNEPKNAVYLRLHPSSLAFADGVTNTNNGSETHLVSGFGVGAGVHIIRMVKSGNSLSFYRKSGAATSFTQMGGAIDLSAITYSHLNSTNSRLFVGTASSAVQIDYARITNSVVSYSWTGPNGFTSSVQNPSLNNFNVATNAGTYNLVVNSNGCMFNASTAVVGDLISPVITCTADINLLANSAAGVVVNYSTPSATDNCSAIVTRTAGLASGATFPIGLSTVTHTATDLAGNSVSCSFQINVTGLPPTIVNPGTVSVTSDNNVCGAVVNYATTSIGIPAPTITYSIASGSIFSIGTTQVIATATNPVGTSSATFDVVVSDNQAPTVLTQNVSIQLDANGAASITVADINNGSFDNCSIASMVLDVTTFDCSKVGANTVTLTVTDVNGNVSSNTASVTVSDVIAATVLTKNASVQLDANGAASITVADINNGSFDNCSIANMVLDVTAFDCSKVGANTVTLTVTDVNGNVSSNTATVNVSDAIAPTVLTQNVSIQLNANGAASITTTDINNGSTDNCTIATIALDKTNFDCTNVGANTVTLTVTDVNGNVSSNTATVTVSDVIAATVLTKNASVQLDANGAASITVADINNGSFDNCSIANMVLDVTAFDCSKVGANTVTLTVTDVNGNVSSNTATVNVSDAIAPTVLTQNVSIQLNANGAASITTTDINNGSTDNCTIATIALDKTNFDCTNVGANTVTLTVTDVNGNVSSNTATVTVSDVIAATVLTKNASVQLDANGAASITVADINNGSFDNCSIASMVLDVTAFDCSKVGANTVTLTVTDVNGNVSSNTATVTVSDVIAATVLTQNASVQLDANGAASITVADINNGSFDNCSIASMVLDVTAFDCSKVGANTVTLTVTDVNGNVSSNTATVTVSDVIAATVLTKNASVQLDANGAASITVADINNGSFDNCSIASMVLDVTAFDCSKVGANTVTLTVTDVNGNVSSNTATVNVSDVIAATVLTQNASVQLDANGAASITVADINNGSFDNCSIASMVLDVTAFDCSKVGANTVTLTVTDVNGNVSSNTATVTVSDVIAATVLTKNASVQLDANGAASITVADINNGSFDNCSIASMVLDVTAFDCSNVGANTVTLTVTDVNGNVSSNTATVTVSDVIAATVLTKNASVQLDANGAASITVADINNGSFDNCSIASMVLDVTAFDCSKVGANTVTLTVTDVNGNVSSNTATVNVSDAIAPTVLTQNVSVQLDANGAASITTTDINNGSFDNCTIATIALDKTNFDCTNVGANTVTLTVTDVNGNVSSNTATVTVSDVIAPIIVALADQTLCESTAASYDIPALEASDNCTIATITYSVTGATTRAGSGANASGGFNVGTSTIAWTVTDVNANVSTYSNTVLINPAPVASISFSGANAFCNELTLTALATNYGPYSYLWSNGETTESINLGLTSPDGVYTVFVTDGNGCTSLTSANYTYAKQSMVNNYTILAYNEAELEDNSVVETGSVGVMSRYGKAKLENGATVNSPGSFVKSPYFYIKGTVSVPNKIYAVTSVVLPTMQSYSGSTQHLPSYTVNQYTTKTLTGNYRDVTIKKGANVTLTGTVYNRISIDEGATVKFTSAVVNIEDLRVGKGNNSAVTRLRFAGNTSVRIKDKVKIEENCIVNQDRYQVTFYFGQGSGCGDNDEDKFSIEGGNTSVIANVMIPGGKLRVKNKACAFVYMTGLYVGYKVESEGRNVIWNSYNCSNPFATRQDISETTNNQTFEEGFENLVAYPNPTTNEFNFKWESLSQELVSFNIYDIAGRLIAEMKDMNPNENYKAGNDFAPGIYLVEATQGSERKILRVVKTK